MEVVVVANDKNWVDASNPLNNFLMALVAKHLTVRFDLDYTDFCPQIGHSKYEVKAGETVAIKFHVPQRSTLSPVIHSLYENTFYASTGPSVHASHPTGTEVVVMQAPECFVSGYAVWTIKNFVYDYFALYSQ
ncbi:unnamed protein product, partial [Gongylonema pulchrum]|uniref:MHD domain-containing protein n=1 Tax=Gongylonema pulchrum TaxID=637853 RepID=A0A183EE50_9BILA